MAYLKSGDRCADCKHCKVWSTDHRKASCKLYTSDQGFHPDRPVPTKCVNKVSRSYCNYSAKKIKKRLDRVFLTKSKIQAVM